jgi:hypothetical protein
MQDFIELMLQDQRSVVIAKSSIATIESLNNDGTLITMKEKRSDGINIHFYCINRYFDIKSQLA